VFGALWLFYLFCIPLAKIIHRKKEENKKEGKKSFCKDVEEKLLINSEVACH